MSNDHDSFRELQESSGFTKRIAGGLIVLFALFMAYTLQEPVWIVGAAIAVIVGLFVLVRGNSDVKEARQESDENAS